ncbi:MAG: 6-phosphogluconolactonase [Verrucomicrobia bacterium]|nr:6-phosphogluconolactonase [Verrucomicrobiota bacterium]
MIETRQFPDEPAWLDALAADFRRLAETAVAARGKVHVALSGGISPPPFYVRLNRELDCGALSSLAEKIQWWLGDERWVAPSDSASNERMVRDTLGRNNLTFGDRFHSWHTHPDPAEAAQRYQRELQRIVGDPTVFDLILLGLGPDGHTASLFPGTTALQEKERDAVSCEVPQLKMTRLTLTFPVLDRARQVWFIVRGRKKEAVVTQLLVGGSDIPATRVKAANQKLYWLPD